MAGSIYRLPDNKNLQRGITYTILPDGNSLSVPAMSRMEVRARAESHTNKQSTDVMQALADMLQGKKAGMGDRAQFNQRGQAHRQQGRADVRRDPMRDAGLRPIHN